MSRSRSHQSKISSKSFYQEWHGHKVRHLQTILPELRGCSDSLIWTAGDSSLDNKYWFRDNSPAIGAYSNVLDPPRSIQDVTFWLNYFLQENDGNDGNRMAAINTAVEATTLNERTRRLRPQDEFLRDNIQSEDILIVSIGGNDVALCPTPCTILSMAGLLCLPKVCIQNSCTSCAVPINDYCCGCGPSTLSCLGSWPPCFGYFRHLFGVRTEKYIEKLTTRTKPKKILVCMVYYLDENVTPSWANASLGCMGYNNNPEKLQLLIQKCYEQITSTIRIPGTEVIPIPLFHVLDGKRSEDYVARVEPSAIGGKKMAEYFLDVINGKINPYTIDQNQYVAPPMHASMMPDRE